MWCLRHSPKLPLGSAVFEPTQGQGQKGALPAGLVLVPRKGPSPLSHVPSPVVGTLAKQTNNICQPEQLRNSSVGWVMQAAKADLCVRKNWLLWGWGGGWAGPVCPWHCCLQCLVLTQRSAWSGLSGLALPVWVRKMRENRGDFFQLSHLNINLVWVCSPHGYLDQQWYGQQHPPALGTGKATTQILGSFLGRSLQGGH